MNRTRPILRLLGPVALLTAGLSPAVMAQMPGHEAPAHMPGLVLLEESSSAGAGDSAGSGFADESNRTVSLGYESESGFGLQADAWQLDATGESDLIDMISPDSRQMRTVPDAGGVSADGSLSLSDIDHEARLRLPGLSGGQSRGVDLTASYVWDSSRFGQFVLSTRATYVYDQNSTDGVREPGGLPLGEDPAVTRVPELQGRLVLTWQNGNHTASASTQYMSSDALQGMGTLDSLDMERLDELVGDLATLDLRYGYNVKTGEKGTTVISVGLRNTFDRRANVRSLHGSDGVLEGNGGVAYGSIKYQF